jgi:hypothetical protein
MKIVGGHRPPLGQRPPRFINAAGACCRYTSTRARRLCRVPFHAGGVAPKVFETVKDAFGLMEDMDNYLEIIEHDPLAGGKSVDGGSANAVVLF